MALVMLDDDDDDDEDEDEEDDAATVLVRGGSANMARGRTRPLHTIRSFWNTIVPFNGSTTCCATYPNQSINQSMASMHRRVMPMQYMYVRYDVP